MGNKNTYYNNLVQTEKEARAKDYHRFYCNHCNGWVLVKHSFTNKKFCKVCNNVISEKKLIGTHHGKKVYG